METFNYFPGIAPMDVPEYPTLPEHDMIGNPASLSYPETSQIGTARHDNIGPATSGRFNYGLAGLGGAYENPAGFAQTLNPLGGVAAGTNLHPSPTGVKGAGDIGFANVDSFFPPAVTLYHTTRAPGGKLSQ